MNDKPTFGSMIRSARKEIGIPLSEVARRAEISRCYLSQIESSKVPPPGIAIIGRISEVLHINPDIIYPAAGLLPPDMALNLSNVIAVYRDHQSSIAHRP